MAATISAQLLIVANIVIVPNMIVSALITSGAYNKAFLIINVVGTALIYACGLVFTHYIGFIGYPLTCLLASQIMLFVLCRFASDHVGSNVRAIDSLFFILLVMGGVILFHFFEHGLALNITLVIFITILCSLLAWTYTKLFRWNEWMIFAKVMAMIRKRS